MCACVAVCTGAGAGGAAECVPVLQYAPEQVQVVQLSVPVLQYAPEQVQVVRASGDSSPQRDWLNTAISDVITVLDKR